MLPDKETYLTKLGEAAWVSIPSAMPDGAVIEDSLSLCTGVTGGTQAAVVFFAQGRLSEQEIKRVTLTGIRLLSGIRTKDLPDAYNGIGISWTDDSINFLREKGLGEIADAFQRAQSFIVAFHELSGHEMI
ncbi:hypothetical protein ACIA8E_07230 [Streptomyces sp. NPDC051664]|uniref:hypothetical protein n=1 Tax=Streptomyces sp. NPDC051664 TaxID=3365668 RepID=UPI0037AE7FF1